MINLIEILQQNRYLVQKDITNVHRFLSLRTIQKIICEELEVPEDSFFSNCLIREVVVARQCFCYFAKLFTSYSLESIGQFIDRDHSTVIYSIKQIKNLMKFNKKTRISKSIPYINRYLKAKKLLKRTHDFDRIS